LRKWDRVFEREHEIQRHSFFVAEPPVWFTRESISSPDPR
jgi:hypothetical protein